MGGQRARTLATTGLPIVDLNLYHWLRPCRSLVATTPRVRAASTTSFPISRPLVALHSKSEALEVLQKHFLVERTHMKIKENLETCITLGLNLFINKIFV
jgi:hypothetical protein